MKQNNHKSCLAFAVLLLMSVSCSDLIFGDRFLGTAPESSDATLDTMFSSRINSEKVLTQAYTGLHYGLPTMGGNVLESLTDLGNSWIKHNQDGPNAFYYNGGLSANVPEDSRKYKIYDYGGEKDWATVRYAWFYLENVDRVPDMTPEEKTIRKGEARMLIALSYAHMFRNIGGVPWIDHAVQPNEEMYFPRLTFGQTVDDIVGMLDEASRELPWTVSPEDDGRMTKAGAMALKIRVLHFAASAAFNSDKKWHPEADQYTCYGNYSIERWKRVVTACEEFFAELERQGGYGLVWPDSETHEARRKAFQKAYYDRGNGEVLISVRKGYNASSNGLFIGENRGRFGPTLNYVNMFPWADGTPFPEDFDWEHPSRQPFYENGVPTRDPRLYETAAVPGSLFYDGLPAPVYINNESFLKENNVGFLWMKFIMETAADRNGRPVQWPYLRLPEVYLSYAEALNEVNDGPDPKAYECLGKVRSRVGLPNVRSDMKKEEFQEALLAERALEFGLEEVRWYDMIRLCRDDLFKKSLVGLRSVGDDKFSPKSFTFSTVQVPDRYWVSNWDPKWLLSPIPVKEINKDYGMTQNPGW